MRTLAATLVTAIALATPALAAESYTNARFGYVLTYPANTFTPQPESDNGDGRHLKAGGADLAVWAAYNAGDATPDAIANGVASNCAPAPQPYRLIKPTVVVVSCATAGGRIVYHKTYIRGGTLTSFDFSYPASEKARWDAVVEKITLEPAK